MAIFHRKYLLVISFIIFVMLFFYTSIYAYQEQDLEEITVLLDWVPNTNHTGLYVAVEEGFYREEGLEVNIIQPSEGGPAGLIAAGQGEFGISYQEQVTYARTSGEPLPVVAIAAIIQHNTSGFASPKNKEIERPLEFEGKKYGGWGSPVEEAMIKALMENDNADFSKTEIVTIGAVDFFAAVQQYVDYTWIYYGWDGVAAELKEFPVNFILLQKYAPELDFYTPVIIAHEQLLNQNPDLVRRFLQATEKGYLFSIANPELAAQALLAHAPEIDQDIAIASQRYLADQYLSDAPYWGFMENQRWKDYAQWMFERGLISQMLDVENSFTNKFLSGEGN
ncbi:MAG: ABC transporter substrate-binding protein [Atribacterota bacterium]|nr:ABC transporter substrate-binding protein [Atribacterota bacterium]